MDRRTINLLKYRGSGDTIFTGRPEGRLARIDLKLDEIDSNGIAYNIIIPKNTTSFNSSFFLGLFFDSIKNLGSLEKFFEKYTIVIEEEDEEWVNIIERNLVECRRKALNELNHSTGIDF